MSKNVFVGVDSFRRLLLGAAGGYELQGHHEAAETVLRVIGTLDELTTGGKGRDRADEDQEAMNRYIKKKTRARSVAKAEADPFAELEGWENLDQIQEAYGYGEITSDRRDKLTDLWEAREAAQRKGKKDGKYHDLVTDMLARAIHSVGIEYADEIAAYEEERRMRRSYYEKVENRANGLQEEEPEEPDPLSPARAAIATAMQAAKVSEVTGAPLPKPLTWKRGFYDTTRTFPSGWYECPVCGCRVDWEPEQCPKCYTRLELEETEG